MLNTRARAHTHTHTHTHNAEWAKQVFSQCFNYEPTDPEMFSDKFGHGFSSFYEDVEQYEDLIDRLYVSVSVYVCVCMKISVLYMDT